MLDITQRTYFNGANASIVLKTMSGRGGSDLRAKTSLAAATNVLNSASFNASTTFNKEFYTRVGQLQNRHISLFTICGGTHRRFFSPNTEQREISFASK
jgi:hypothetical protein